MRHRGSRKGLVQWNRETNNEALRHFYRAIELDPNFASAYGMAARCYLIRKGSGWMIDRAQEAAETARRTFEEGALSESLPTIEIARAELERGLGVLGAFVKAGLVASNGEARRQIKGGGLKVNDAPVTDEKMMLTQRDLTPEGVIKLSLGRKRHVLLRPV